MPLIENFRSGQAWDSLDQWSRTAYHLRRLLTGQRVDAKKDRVALYVGVKPYEAAGGTVMDRNTQQNAAMVEQAAAAADSLREQAERMRAAFSVFRLAASRSEGRVQRLHGVVRADALRARRAA